MAVRVINQDLLLRVLPAGDFKDESFRELGYFGIYEWVRTGNYELTEEEIGVVASDLEYLNA